MAYAPVIIGALVALVNMLILFELNRLNNEIMNLRLLGERVTRLESEVQSCPACRESTGR